MAVTCRACSRVPRAHLGAIHDAKDLATTLGVDGIVMKRSWAGEVRNVSLLVAIAACLGLAESAAA